MAAEKAEWNTCCNRCEQRALPSPSMPAEQAQQLGVLSSGETLLPLIIPLLRALMSPAARKRECSPFLRPANFSLPLHPTPCNLARLEHD